MKTKITFSAHEIGLENVYLRLESLKTEAMRARTLRFLLAHLIEVGQLPQWFLAIPSNNPPLTSQITVRLELKEHEPAMSQVIQWLNIQPTTAYPRQIKYLLSSVSTPLEFRLPKITKAPQTSPTVIASPLAASPQASVAPLPSSPSAESGLAIRNRSGFSEASSFFQTSFEPPTEQ